MTEQTENQLPELEVPFTFHGSDGEEIRRSMWVRMPRPEQILVWQRTLKRLADSPPDTSWSGSEVMVMLERLRKIIDSVLVNNSDVNWIDDQFLDETLTFQTLAPMVTQAVAAFQPADNREDRRAAAKKTAKKAVRKKVIT